MNRLRLAVVGSMLCTVLAAGVATGRRAQEPGETEPADRLFTQSEPYEVYRARVLDAKTEPGRIGPALARAIACLEDLGREDEVDALCAAVDAAHPATWRWRQTLAEMYLTKSRHYGYIVAGRFHRGYGPRGEPDVGTYERDRSRAVQLLVRGLDRATTDPDRGAAGGYLLALARALLGNRATYDCWRLQSLTPLDVPADHGAAPYPYYWGQRQAGAAPVEPDGTPVFYREPESFEKARNDGERWRWALAKAAQLDPSLLIRTRLELASFLLSQFGTQTMTESTDGDNDRPGALGPDGLATLPDDETIARLAIGIRRFKLPDEFNPIKIYQSIADGPATAKVELALNGLAAIFENRRQLDRAVNFLEKNRALYGNGADGWKQKRLDQMLRAWGEFENVRTQLAGRRATVDFRFRNGRRAHFEAHEVLVGKLLQDVRDYISSRPKRIDWRKINISDIGSRLVRLNQNAYLGRRVARWDQDLEPAPGHLDKRMTVTTPLQNAGAYLLTATMQGGNSSRLVVWLDDTIIIKKPLAGRNYYYVADARTGQPVPRADVAMFGWRSVQADGSPAPPYLEMMTTNGPDTVTPSPQAAPVLDKKDDYRIETTTLSLKADDQGQVQVPASRLKGPEESFEWLVTARTAAGRFAHLGFVNTGYSQDPESYYRGSTDIGFTITDRPVYRPGALVRFKLLIGQRSYDQPAKSAFAAKPVTVEILNPRRDRIFTRRYTADAFGGVDDSFQLPSDAMLGGYQIRTEYSNGWFQVEEYKKPEFEVTIEAPTAPVILGEKITATIKANYYFGGPVAHGSVKYKITRAPADEQWYPPGRWDWLFGPGYWWFGAESSWYPGWSRWGMPGLAPYLHGVRPEVVAEAVASLRPDGALAVEIDTAAAKAAHPDQDQRYNISAEVTDESRRTVVGTGTVLVARQPFRVYTWVDHGHYRLGDTIEASISAHTLARQPVAGKGTLRLLKIAYDAKRRPVETPVESWDAALDAQGQAHQVMKASAAGQYRLAATIDDGNGHVIEGGYLLTITGQGFDSASFRFNDLEIVPERKEYRPGETLRLQINTNQINSTVLLFVRPTNGVYQPPKVIHLRGKSTVEEIGIVPSDMPNLFVEGVTIADGKVHEVIREIAVPPESRFVDIAVEPSQTTYKPGQKAKLKVKLNVPADRPGGPRPAPFVGSTVLTVYDKALEYIAGGSNVPWDIKLLWSWTRSHRAQSDSSFDRLFHNELRPNEVAMQNLGEFLGLTGAGELLLERPADEQTSDIMYSLSPLPRAVMIHMRAAAAEVREPVIRTNFADTAFWAPTLTTAADGTAEVEFTLPESLTTWKVKSWAMGLGARVGQAETEIVTTKDLLVRPQAPRFFVEKDEVVLSANVHNRLKTKKNVQAVLELDGSVLEPLGATARTVEIAAGSEHRVDWRVKVAHEGQAVIRMKALTDEESDAAQLSFPAYIHGMLKLEAFAGTIRPGQEKAQVVVRVPAERKQEQSRLEVRYSPTLAGALVDALPYLADYPYGCTEQTLNRFLPTVIAQKVLINLGVDLKAIHDKHTNLNAQQLGDGREPGKAWSGYEHNPVFDQAEVAKMAAAGMGRLADMQLSEGGWGWFSGHGESASAHTTALVVHGLQIARGNDLKLPDDEMLRQGVDWLTDYQAKQAHLIENGVSELRPFKRFADDTDALVFLVLTDAAVRHNKMFAFLDRDRAHLSIYAQAMYGLALQRLGERAKLAAVLQNIGQYVVRDDENQTAYIKLPNEDYWWRWYGSEVETHAFYLKLLARTDPQGELAPRLVKYVLNNRRHGRYWSSTRDTAYCIEALADYLKASGEDRPDMTVTIGLDGRTKKEVKITPADLFSVDNSFVLAGQALATGEHTVSFLKQGKGPLYYSAYLTNFTLEDPIIHTGLEIKVDRQVYRLVKDDKVVDVAGGRGQTVGQRVESYRRELLAEGATLRSGELVEVELEIDSKNAYEYLVFEDYKAAGFEPVEVRSGYNGNDLGAYVEFRDERVAFFARAMARGKHSVSYRLRAEIPGRFHALPARAQAMYAPELRANSDEIQLRVRD